MDDSLCRDGSVYVLCIVITVHFVDLVYISANSSSIILLSFLKCRLLPICEVRKCVSCVCCWAELVEVANSLAPQLTGFYLLCSSSTRCE